MLNLLHVENEGVAVVMSGLDLERALAALGETSRLVVWLYHVEGMTHAEIGDVLDTTFEVDGSGTIRIIPLQLVMISLGLLFSPPIWRGIMSMRRSG